MNYYEEKEQRSAQMLPYLEKIVLLLLVILTCSFGLTVCAPAMTKEGEYQSQRLSESLNEEAKYRAHEYLKDGAR